MPDQLPDNYTNYLFIGFPDHHSYSVNDAPIEADSLGIFMGIAPGETDDPDTDPAGRALNRLFELGGWQLDLFKQAVRNDGEMVVVGFALSSRAEQPFEDVENRTVFGLDEDDLNQWLGD